MAQLALGRRRVVGTSVRGSVHRRDGLPNQDAIAWTGPTGPGGSVVVALSDGHGSRKSFRSDTGARFAVDAAVEVGRIFVEFTPTAELSAAVVEETCGLLATEIVSRWNGAVADHLAAFPLSEPELAELAQTDGAAARQAVEDDPDVAYGATLMVVVVLEAFAMFLQLGDGDILVVSPSGEARRPLADDPRLMGNETTSLCMSRAEGEFRSASEPLPLNEPTILLVATDGLGNAYPDERSFLQVGADLVTKIREEGLDRVAEELEGYLEEASAHSGDDVTLAVVSIDVRQDAERSEPAPPEQG
ncbi:MAG: protein phosphatase 2C domain-containing protein [Actinomycetota bacterium]|nr:protein phosphatase 2C domain-containing protein [Actinomycetota bacterium]